MKILLLVILTMVAFAANSILSRLGIDRFGTDPMVFAVIRVLAGATTLALLVVSQGGQLLLRGGARLAGGMSLTVYMVGFSAAYLTLDAGLGALVLFGVVQMVMFGWAVLLHQSIPIHRWIGMTIAFGGLVLLLWPGGHLSVDVWAAGAMVLAGVGWGVYSILGQRETDPLAATASNFLVSLPMVALTLLASDALPTLAGGVTAVLAGAVTSGLGYALWYRILPQLATTVAATAQLSVPVIAVAAGAVLLGENISLSLIVAGLLVLGGIAVSIARR